MEADWSVEIGKGLPVIAAPWEGWIDLRKAPSRIREIPEALANPSLAQALAHLNSPQSPVFTSKCDRWHLPADEIDPFEFDASQEESRTGLACYVDILLRDQNAFASFGAHERWVLSASAALRQLPLPQCRADFVLRPAVFAHQEGFGITLYIAACSRNQATAQSIFESALNRTIAITIETSPSVGE
ncbi:MAG TPA: hypothetical protein VFA02_06690 [Pseudacidobacterium sp.]|nr:hypothetical protein [Pseudacidobacterium sp.]